MGEKESSALLNLHYLSLLVILVLSLPLFVCSQCNINPVIFNFGDSNSDTGGLAAGTGSNFGPSEGRIFFHQPSGRLCDGRLVIDFLCESLNTSYLSPYLESLGSNFTSGANFAISGSSTLPRSVPFSLNIQVQQFIRFQNRSLQLKVEGLDDLVGDEEFKNALYTIDIGQNDLAAAFGHKFPFDVIVEKISAFISEIQDAILGLYRHGGKNFWVHNTGPLGCLPSELANRSEMTSDFDQYGCLQSLNVGAKVYNQKLSDLCEELRKQLKNVTIVYVDMYAVKYDLIAKYAIYGFENPLMACCGYGGAPYNFNPDLKCGVSGSNVCKEGSKYISWDGVHYTEAANAIVASKILSGEYSMPKLKFNHFCNS